MNKPRRSQLNAIQDRITELSLLDLLEKITSIKDDLESLKDEEQDYYDNMPDGLQSSERGEASNDAITAMVDAIELLARYDDMDGVHDEAFEKIEEAKGVQ